AYIAFIDQTASPNKTYGYYTMSPWAAPAPIVDPSPGGLPPSGPLPDLTAYIPPGTSTGYTGFGYPVLVDPVGFNIIYGLSIPPSPAGASWVGNMDGATAGPGGGTPPPGIRRVTVQYLSNTTYDAMLATAAYKTQKTLRWCALLDDMTLISDS